jgi:hypothetical protein
MIGFLVQKSPPDGGRAVDDRKLVDQSRHRAARLALCHHHRRAAEVAAMAARFVMRIAWYGSGLGLVNRVG